MLLKGQRRDCAARTLHDRACATEQARKRQLVGLRGVTSGSFVGNRQKHVN